MIQITPFDGDTLLHAEVARLVGKWGVDVAFETGTYHGHTAVAFSLLCERTFTAEIDQENYSRSCELFESVHERGNIFAVHDTSPKALKMNLSDAHWESYWPLLDELKVISELDAPLPVIVIHDFKVPDRLDLGFDSYAGQDLDFDYIRESLESIYGSEGYNHHFNILSIGACRGVIFVEPKK
jgi:hypothetical protein